MRSAKSGPSLYHIWHVFGPWAIPYGANGQMTMTVQSYRPRQFHRTFERRKSIQQLQRYGFHKSGRRPAAHPPGSWLQYPSSPEGWGLKKIVLFWNEVWNDMMFFDLWTTDLDHAFIWNVQTYKCRKRTSASSAPGYWCPDGQGTRPSVSIVPNT